jgi:hypothetical protein
MRSSWAVALPRRGPIRLCTRPRYRTGGESAGSTMITAMSAAGSRRLATTSEGGGTMFPSVLTSARERSSSSVTEMPEGDPSSRAPMKTTPARRWSGRSLAMEQC